MSGLPRSGSTLLSTLLRQNPTLRPDIAGLVAPLIGAVQANRSELEVFSVLFDDARYAQMLRGMFGTYYTNVVQPSVRFDTNKAWAGEDAILGMLHADSKIICCVRDIGWIIDNFECMRLENPLKLSKLFGQQSNDSFYTRVAR